MKPKNKLLMACLTLSLATNVAVAQDQGLEEVIVTAQKRAESLQNVPISITAMTGQQLAALGAENATQIAAQVPNLHIDGAFGPNGPPQLSLRGVSILDFSDANESSVAMYIDDIYKGTVSGQVAQLFDLERVEVLRGPQGTLYGRNTPGGVVHFISARPTEQPTGGASLQLGSFQQRIAEAFLSGPLSERLRGRIAMKYNRDDGYQTNWATGTRLAQTDVFAIRGLIDWQPSDSLTVSGKLFHSNSRGSHPGYGFYGTLDPITGAPCSTNRILDSQCANDAGFRDPKPDPKHAYSEFRHLPDELRNSGGSLHISWDVDDLQLVSITGYETLKKSLREDCDAAAISGLVCYGDWTADTSQFTQELRLSGQSSALRWITGAYYYEDRKLVDVVIPPFGGFGSYATTKAKSWALFAQGDFAITDRLTAVAGVRYTAERRALHDLTGVLNGVGGTREGTPFFGPLSDSQSSSKPTGKIGLELRPHPGLMTYATVSTGFKSGMFNTTLLGEPGERGPVGEETIIAYEVGLKSSWWDERIRLNAAAFHYDYSDFQASAVITTNGLPVARFINAGDVKMSGGELELNLLPSKHWEIGLGAGFLHTRIHAPASTSIGGVPLDGKEAPASPAVSLNGFVRYQHDVGSYGSASLQMDFSWKDHFFFNPDNDPFESQDAYGLVNLRATWRSPTGRYETSAFVQNIFDEHYATFGFISPTFPGAYKVWGLPRWAGVKLAVGF